jgi:hypothetical protein
MKSVKRLLNRLTGISTPVGGVTWNPPELEVNVADELITLLENRRMLYVPYVLQYAPYVVESVRETRTELSELLKRVDRESELGKSMRAMQAACRKFLTDTEQFGENQAPIAPEKLAVALGELRGVFGIHVAVISAAYGLDIEGDLEAILPVPEDPELDDRPG